MSVILRYCAKEMFDEDLVSTNRGLTVIYANKLRNIEQSKPQELQATRVDHLRKRAGNFHQGGRKKDQPL